MRYLLDTNVISELRRHNPNRGVLTWFDGRGSWELCLSVLTIGEISAGAHRIAARDAEQARAIQEWLQTMIAGFENRILPVTLAIAADWGQVVGIRPVGDVDGLIAATARVHECTVITRNVGHFDGLGVSVENPFDS